MTSTHKISNLLARFVLTGTGSEGTARGGLQRLLLLRTFVTVVSVIGLLIFQSLSELPVPLLFLTWLFASVIASILFGYMRLKTAWAVSNPELFAHVLVDVVILLLLLLNTGGVTNPLISYLLVLLAVTATMLPRAYVNSFALGSILIYTFFLILDLQVEHGPGNGGLTEETTFQLHLVGMWVIFLVSAVLIALFITRMAGAIRERETNLAKARENEIRNEQLVAIGTLAAGTAHALGTPLSTMAVLLADLDQLDDDQLREQQLKDDIAVLKQQVYRCKDSLTQLTRYYNKHNVVEQEQLQLTEFVHDIRDYIINVHPMAHVDFIVDGDDDPVVSSDLSVKHAVINIIENGIKAAHSKVEVRFQVIAEQSPHVEIKINDDGPGIPSKVMENMGEPFISMRKESMGLGIFLANAAIQRLGGTIEMFNLKLGGALTLIKLPLHDYGQA